MNENLNFQNHLLHVAERFITEDSVYQVLMAFVNENGETISLHKAAITEKVNFSKPIVASVTNALYCTGYLDEVAYVGKSKIYALSDLGFSLIQQIISVTEQQ
ncbi:MarR family transcriptional regulator [Bacillus sp. BP-3]|uniref:MarR family transcriptional regulator n=1 Tax=Bacillus sp. BP-3 TaxID=3022773 RepID=UPI00232E72F6|nr:MarR family transcriptional regulator [Bacillus sp. BP-3]MDC2867758.1 MarR family transcriptional regulator [Bacillus sp. BP-3]